MANVGLGSHYRPTVNKRSLARLERICATLDEEPALWPAYSETFKIALKEIDHTLDVRAQVLDNMVGSDRGGPRKAVRTRRARQMEDRNHLLSTRPHICELCGIELTPQAAQVHHKIEIQDGGESTEENMQLLCKPCHRQQHYRVQEAPHAPSDTSTTVVPAPFAACAAGDPQPGSEAMRVGDR
jgi:hypothetical protein